MSVVGLGCNTFGREIDEVSAGEIVQTALEEGITFFDTADMYGAGTSEEILAKSLGSRRDTVVVATKFGMPVDGVPGSGGARPGYIKEAVERSLRKLKREWIDLYQLHQPDPATPLEESLAALYDLVDEGKVREIGCSDVSPDQLKSAVSISRRLSRPAFASAQTEYSVVHREPEDSGLVRACEALGVALLPYRPLAKGLLTGRMTKEDPPMRQLAKERYRRYLTKGNFMLVDQIKEFAFERGRHPVEVALVWLLKRPMVSTVFPGATRPDQVRLNAAAGGWVLTPDEVAELNSIVEVAPT